VSLSWPSLNAFYAQGVQDFNKRLRVHTRRIHHLPAAEVGNANDLEIAWRDVVIGQMSFEWLKRFLPEWYAERPKSLEDPDHPLDSEKYLSLRFFGTETPWRTAIHAD
jgi:hypothetical protein